MKRIKKNLSVLLLLSTLAANAQLSRTAADNLVLNTIINDTTKVIYAMEETLARGESVMTADGIEYENPYENSYVYFIDDIPAANWNHTCRYLFVNKLDGLYTVFNETMLPNDYKSFTRIGMQPNRSIWQWPYQNYTIPSKAAPNGKLYAVLIAGISNGSDIKRWYSLSCVYTALVNKYGFIEDINNSHIFVCADRDIEDALSDYYHYGLSTLYAEYDLNHSGEVSNCQDFNHTYSTKRDIEIVFDQLAGSKTSSDNIPELTEEDQLFVMICGDGSKTTNNSRVRLTSGSNTEYLYDYDLTNWVRNIKCSQMTFLIDCNFSGGFIDNLMNDNLAACKNRAVHTSTDATHYSWTEKHITMNNYYRGGGNGSDAFFDKVDEYTYYWSAASLGYYPIIEIYDDSTSGPWYKYDNTGIGQFQWNEFNSFNEGAGYSHVGYDVNPDTDQDGVVSMDEAFKFADNLDSYSRRGYFNPTQLLYYDSDAGVYDTCVEYPSKLYESTFTKELITLDGYRGTISNDAETGVGHKYTLVNNLPVAQNATLTINDNCIIRSQNIILENYGTVTTGQNINNATFKKVRISNKGGNMTLKHCTFDTCNLIATYDGLFRVENSTFNKTLLVATVDDQQVEPYNVIIKDNDFNNSTMSNRSIYLDRVPYCDVSGNNITCGGDGIYINGLTGLSNNYIFSDNEITNCGGHGFVSYNSNAKLYGNTISYNDNDGIRSLNTSSLYIRGDSLASTIYDTQRIIQNGRYQVYASNNSYPQDFHYNHLLGNGTSTDYILYYESNNPFDYRPFPINVNKNCWNPLSNNSISSHLYTNGNLAFSYLPTWTPTGPFSMPNRSETMLDLGDSYVENGNYEEARDIYMEIVSEYPESIEAVGALKALFAIERETSGNFVNLKNYYLGLLSDNYLGDMADNLANKCDVEMSNYIDAIGWYESKITDTDALYSDRVFAEIDLGDLYLQMEKDGSKGIQGKMTEYVPESKETHEKRTHYLLSTIPGESEHSAMSNMSVTNALNTTKVTCSPNPANDNITLSYTLEQDSDVEINILNVYGKMVKNVNISKQLCGSHSIDLDISKLPEGIYYGIIKPNNNDKKTIKIIKH